MFFNVLFCVCFLQQSFVVFVITTILLLLLLLLLQNVIKESMSGAPDGNVITKFNITVYRRDLLTLAPGEWLNDQVSWQFL
jgi:hypothetical protein